MRQFLNSSISVLIFLSTTVICLKVENICLNNTFYLRNKSHEYKTPLVNSIYRFNLQENLPSFEKYMINLEPGMEEVLKKNPQDKLIALIKKYNKVIFDILAEKTAEQLYENSLINLYQMNFNYYKDLIKRNIDNYKSTFGRSSQDFLIEIDRVNESCYKRFERGDQLLDIMTELKKGHLSTNLIPKEIFKALLESEDFSLTNEKPVFQDELIDFYYSNRIVKLLFSKINRTSKLFFSFKSYVTLFFTIFIPFENGNYTQKLENCTSIEKLPDFYKNFDD